MEVAGGERPAARRRRGEQLELEIDSLAFGGRGVARAEGLVVFVAGALPGDRVRARGNQVEAPLRRGADGRAAATRRPTGSPTSACTRASPARAPPGRASPTSGSSPTSGARSTRRCGGSASSTASSSRRSCRRWSSGATATSSSTPSASATARRRSASTPAGAGTGSSTSTTACSPPSAGNAARNEVRDWARASRSPPTTRASGAACCATWSSARAGAPGRSRPAWSPPRPLPEAAGRPAHARSRATPAAPTARPARSARSACARSSAT